MTRPGYTRIRDPHALRYLTHPVGGRRPHRRWIRVIDHTEETP